MIERGYNHMRVKPKIYIDAGHGGRDPGAVNRQTGLREADVTFEVSRILGDMLEGGGCDVMLSRPPNAQSTLTIDQRIAQANAWGADYYLSIHVNAGGGTGAETFYFRASNLRSQQSAAFAHTINLTYANIMGLRNRGVKPDTQTFLGSIGVLRRPKMPSALVELAFIDALPNAPDINILSNYHVEMANALFVGVMKHLEIDLEQDTQADEEAGYFPIAEINVRRLVDAGVISSPEFWKGITHIEWLNELMANAYYSQTLDPRIDNGITDIGTAIGTLEDAGVMRSPEYWKNLVRTGNFEYLCQLILNMANRSRIILEKIVMAEAGGEDEMGQILVANVINNRHNDSGFPSGIHNIVFQAGDNSKGKRTYQFSPVGNGAYARAIPSPQVKGAVTAALDGVDNSRGALFFRSVRGAEGSWHETALQRLFVHGGHIFYSPQGDDRGYNTSDLCT